MAAQAYRDYGRGSGHPARLNLGDSYSYALASVPVNRSSIAVSIRAHRPAVRRLTLRPTAKFYEEVRVWMAGVRGGGASTVD